MSLELVELWDGIIAVEWEHLTAANIAGYLSQDPFGLVGIGGVTVAVVYILCHMDDMNRLIGGESDTELVACTSETYLCVFPISVFARDLPWSVTLNGVTHSGRVNFRNVSVSSLFVAEFRLKYGGLKANMFHSSTRAWDL